MADKSAKNPFKLLQPICEALAARKISFSICGGIAASFYRLRPRFTNDIDIAIAGSSAEESQAEAIKLLESLGLKTSLGWIEDRRGALTSPAALVIGQEKKDSFEGSIDILLPLFPWVNQAVSRGQHNLIDFGFARLPVITPEDLIIAKAFAVNMEQNRFTDLDDIQSICRSKTELDLLYLITEFERLGLTLPPVLDREVPSPLKRIIKQNRRKQ